MAFDLPQVTTTWPPFSVERIWAKKTSSQYELELMNVPFFVRGVAFRDVIRVKPDHERRELVFDGLVRHCGHSVVRLIFRDRSPSLKENLLADLREYGCTWEFSNVDFHVAIDVPPNVEYKNIRSRLLRHLVAGEVEIEEAYIAPGHLPE